MRQWCQKKLTDQKIKFERELNRNLLIVITENFHCWSQQVYIQNIMSGAYEGKLAKTNNESQINLALNCHQFLLLPCKDITVLNNWLLKKKEKFSQPWHAKSTINNYISSIAVNVINSENIYSVISDEYTD